MAGEFKAWLAANGGSARPWLIAGAGALADKLASARAEGFGILAVGEAAAGMKADVAFVVDVETLHTKGEAIAANADVVAVPREPHEDGWPTRRVLDSYSAEVPVLRRLDEENRVLAFDLWTAEKSASDDVIVGDFAGEEAPLRLLASGGARTMRHLGMRSRDDASAGFESMVTARARRNGGGVAEARRTLGLSYGPYGYPVPARIFVGTDDEQMIGVKVLAYSVGKFSTMDVTVEPLDWRDMPVPRDPKNRSKTGFSFCRFDIPRLCGYSGRGVYVDADMLVFADITNLWTLPMEDADLLHALSHPSQGRTPQTSVMLLNCEALSWDVKEIIRGLDEERYSYKELMSDLCVVPEGRVRPLLPYWWNSLEIYEPGRTSLIHYTDMPTQPWVSHENRNGDVWYATCAEAVDSGYVSSAEIEAAVENGHVSPEIFDWIRQPAPKDFSDISDAWVAPFHRFMQPGRPEGAVRLTSDGRVVGWAWDPKKPDEAIEIGLFDGSRRVLTHRADAFGEFLKRHGKGNGMHAFDLPLPDALNDADPRHLTVRTVEKKVELKGSPLRIGR